MEIKKLRQALGTLYIIFLSALSAYGQFTTYSVSSVNHTRHTNAGNLLIGSTTQTTAALDKLEVVGNIRASGNLLMGLTSGTGLLHLNSTTNNFNLRLNTTDRLTILNSSGFVGIGTNTPSDLLHVNGLARANQFNSVNGVYNSLSSLFLQTSGSTRLTIMNSGNVGIGVASPGHLLDVGGMVNANGFKIAGTDVVSSQWVNNGTNINFNANGVVSIGTSNAPFGYKLAVGGKIVAEEVVVKLQANWPDYVFRDDYKMMSLEEINAFIKANKHLPGVPTAQEVKENGIPLGEMNAILLKKIEELTILLIQQSDRIKTLENQLNK